VVTHGNITITKKEENKFSLEIPFDSFSMVPSTTH
jgi:hypothetical protein